MADEVAAASAATPGAALLFNVVATATGDGAASGLLAVAYGPRERAQAGGAPEFARVDALPSLASSSYSEGAVRVSREGMSGATAALVAVLSLGSALWCCRLAFRQKEARSARHRIFHGPRSGGTAFERPGADGAASRERPGAAGPRGVHAALRSLADAVSGSGRTERRYAAGAGSGDGPRGEEAATSWSGSPLSILAYAANRTCLVSPLCCRRRPLRMLGRTRATRAQGCLGSSVAVRRRRCSPGGSSKARTATAVDQATGLASL